MHHIWIEGDRECPERARIYVDEKEIHRVRSYELRHDALSIPVLTLLLSPKYTIEECGKVECIATPETIEDAVKILKQAREHDHGRFTEAIQAIFKEREDG